MLLNRRKKLAKEHSDPFCFSASGEDATRRTRAGFNPGPHMDRKPGVDHLEC